MTEHFENANNCYSTKIAFNLEWAQYGKALHNSRLEGLTMGKHSSLLGPFFSYKEKSVVNTAPSGQNLNFEFFYILLKIRHLWQLKIGS